MIAISIDPAQLIQLREATALTRKSLPKEMATVINKVLKKTKLNIGRDIRKTINLKKVAAERTIKIHKMASATNLTGRVGIGKEQRLGLQHFGGRQNRRGVSYKIAKNGARQQVDGAFMGPRPGAFAPKLYGGVFKRVGADRLPIVKLKGVSPYGAYAKNKFFIQEEQTINENLAKEMKRRIELNILRFQKRIK